MRRLHQISQVVTDVLITMLLLGHLVVGQGEEETNNNDNNIFDTNEISQLASVNYTNCHFDDYYSGLPADSTLWTKEDLTALLKQSHRNAVPIYEIHQALMDLDPGAPDNNNNTVQLIYSNTPMSSTLPGEAESWTYEQLWPPERGVSGDVASTDVHNLRPERTRVTWMRRDLLFGSCGTVQPAELCEAPTSVQTVRTDGTIWYPPANVIGDIARALLYMDVRYSANETETSSSANNHTNTNASMADGDFLNLNLVDCMTPFARDRNEMGYLSQLLQWHMDDPVDDAERTRNDLACSKYQGNRNPFVDYPDLASQLFGQPQTLDAAQHTYESCPSRCSHVPEGAIVPYAVEMVQPNNIGFIALYNIPGGTDLYVTDNAWTGSSFLSNEGVVRLKVPEPGFLAGQDFGYGPAYVANNQPWENVTGNFSLDGVLGDTFIVYCLLKDDVVKPLMGFSSNSEVEGGWLAPDLTPDDYGLNYSALPDSLLQNNASLALPHFGNHYYNGMSEGYLDQLRTSMFNPNDWIGQDSILRFNYTNNTDCVYLNGTYYNASNWNYTCYNYTNYTDPDDLIFSEDDNDDDSDDTTDADPNTDTNVTTTSDADADADSNVTTSTPQEEINTTIAVQNGTETVIIRHSFYATTAAMTNNDTVVQSKELPAGNMSVDLIGKLTIGQLIEPYRLYVHAIVSELNTNNAQEQRRLLLLRQKQQQQQRQRRLAVSLDEDSIALVHVGACPSFDTALYEACEELEGRFDILVQGEEDPTEVIQERYFNATQLGVEDGSFSGVISDLDPESTYIILPPTSLEEDSTPLSTAEPTLESTEIVEEPQPTPTPPEANETINTTTPPEAEEEQANGRSFLFWIWIGLGSLGGCVFLLGICVIVWKIRRKRRNNNEDDGIDEQYYMPESSNDNDRVQYNKVDYDDNYHDKPEGDSSGDNYNTTDRPWVSQDNYGNYNNNDRPWNSNKSLNSTDQQQQQQNGVSDQNNNAPEHTPEQNHIHDSNVFDNPFTF